MAKHAFGGPRQSSNGSRVNGDSFVGGAERRKNYSTSGNLLALNKLGMTKAAQEVMEEEAELTPGKYSKTGPQNSTGELPHAIMGRWSSRASTSTPSKTRNLLSGQQSTAKLWNCADGQMNHLPRNLTKSGVS
jgi:hypothetical protein